MVNDFVKDKVLSTKLGLTKKQEQDLIKSLSECYTKFPYIGLDTILSGIKQRDIYYDSWILGIDVMN